MAEQKKKLPVCKDANVEPSRLYLTVAEKLAIALKDQIHGLVTPAVVSSMSMHAKLGPFRIVCLTIRFGRFFGRVECDTEECILDHLE